MKVVSCTMGALAPTNETLTSLTWRSPARPDACSAPSIWWVVRVTGDVFARDYTDETLVFRGHVRYGSVGWDIPWIQARRSGRELFRCRPR